ncbi:MGMT family protein [Cohnella fermenti]|uniref:DNA methyltransferase n=1 Tax=Cohnella fermenti TaxID=2565925 RepID=A0A4V3WGG6_9BACL|nr:MGMT family protein [Cohnella fermenti]THF84199.1 DNA methyltransferase [Cohnella fermenti]
MQPFTQRVISVIRSIPPGRVMSYGQVAAAAGSPRAARQVVRILHSSSEKHGLPWHRVVNKLGEVAIQEEEGRYTQRVLLEGEGVEFGLGGRIDLEEYAHIPELESEPEPDEVDTDPDDIL